MPLQPGAIIHNNRYKVDQLLGQGGFGAVYRAYDLNLKSYCALKENLDVTSEAQRQFEREALILAGLRHPNLPRVMDYFFLPGQGQYLVMDYVDGEDLQAMLDRQGSPLAEPQALDWILQICDALTYLHTQKPPIIHRDIKPANIKVTPQGLATLVDFGIAKVYDPHRKTTVGARGVTPGYSPIEQYGQGVTDGRTDLYALGATLYTLLTYTEPPESIARITGVKMNAPRAINPLISTNVERAILGAMEILATQRFQTVAEFKEALIAPAAISIQPAPSGTRAAFTSTNIPSFLNSGATVSLRSKLRKPGFNPAHLDWVNIPAGEFLYGDSRQKIYLPDFQITRFPVTNAQYKAYLDANPNVKGPRHWPGRNVPRNKERHPVVNITRSDAEAFCVWCGGRLPTEEEWEKAARGVDGRPYPWGDQWVVNKYCNSREVNLGETTPVDRYPDGASPYGVMDLSGNVWEFTASEEGGQIVLRGGSWEYGAQNVRVAKRYLNRFDVRNDSIGFRVAR